MGGGEQVVGDTVALEELQEAVVILFVNLFHRLAFPIGSDGDGRPVRIGTADHQDVVPFQAVEAGNDVTGQMRAGDVADMDLGIGIGPGNGDQNVIRHSCLRNFYHKGSRWYTKDY